MAKKKKTKVVQMLSPENYIRQKARSLPLYECYVNTGWEKDKFANISVARRHVNGNVTACFYLVDLGCLGVKDTDYLFNISETEYRERIQKTLEHLDLKKIDYILAHNIIFAGYEFADDYGFAPHKDFLSVTKFMLEEDTDEIELIEIECGEDGKPMYVQGPFDNASTTKRIINQLERTAGTGNYHFILAPADSSDEIDEIDDYEEDSDDSEEEDYDEEFDMTYEEAREIFNRLSDKMDDHKEEEIRTFAIAINRLFVEFVDLDLHDEFYNQFMEDLDIEVETGEIPDELLGLAPDDPRNTPETKESFRQIYNLAAEKPKKALKLLEQLKKTLPGAPGTAFLELYLFEDSDNPLFKSKLQQYALQYPEYQPIRLMWLQYDDSINQIDEEDLNNLKGLKAVFKDRDSIHEIELAAYLFYCSFMVNTEGNPSMLDAFMQVIGDLDFSEQLQTTILTSSYLIKLFIIQEYLKQENHRKQ